jgi:hypothetical protein
LANLLLQGRGANMGATAMSKQETDRAQLLLADDGPGRIYADMEAFFEFSFYMAEELEDLVALWEHKSAPAATGERRLG